jgi:hypothetical protein
MARQITVLLLKLQSSWIAHQTQVLARELEKRRQFGLRSASADAAVNVTIGHDLSPSMLLGGIRK